MDFLRLSEQTGIIALTLLPDSSCNSEEVFVCEVGLILLMLSFKGLIPKFGGWPWGGSKHYCSSATRHFALFHSYFMSDVHKNSIRNKWVCFCNVRATLSLPIGRSLRVGDASQVDAVPEQRVLQLCMAIIHFKLTYTVHVLRKRTNLNFDSHNQAFF